MPRFRKKPVEIEAVQWTGSNIDEATAFLNGGGKFLLDGSIAVRTIHGEEAIVRAGDWIMPEPKTGHFYPCKPDIFAATYDPVIWSGTVTESGAVPTKALS